MGLADVFFFIFLLSIAWELVELGINAFFSLDKKQTFFVINKEAEEGYYQPRSQAMGKSLGTRLGYNWLHVTTCHCSIIPDNRFVFCDSNFLKKTAYQLYQAT